MNEKRIEVTRRMSSSPGSLFSLLADPQGHVAIDASGMLMDPEGEPVTAVGDRFVVHMDREALGDLDWKEYDVEVVITAFDPDREIAWTVEGRIKPPLEHVYGYRLEPVDDDRGRGTLVTSYYDWSRAPETWAAGFPVISEAHLKASLGILDRTARRGYVRG